MQRELIIASTLMAFVLGVLLVNVLFFVVNKPLKTKTMKAFIGFITGVTIGILACIAIQCSNKKQREEQVVIVQDSAVEVVAPAEVTLDTTAGNIVQP